MQEQDRPFKAQLADYFREQARWREIKAEEYPEDRRNERSAEALVALAAYVEGLPDDDEDFRLLAAVHEPFGLDVFSPGEEGASLVNRFGFDNAPQRPGRQEFGVLLRHLAEVEASAAVDAEHEEAHDPERDDG